MPPLESKAEQSWAGWLDLTLWLAAQWARRILILLVILALLGIAWYLGMTRGINIEHELMLARGCLP